MCELLPAAGEDLVDGEAAEVVSPQEPVQHVVQHAGGADLGLANTITPSLFSLSKKNQINLILIGVFSDGSYQSKSSPGAPAEPRSGGSCRGDTAAASRAAARFSCWCRMRSDLSLKFLNFDINIILIYSIFRAFSMLKVLISHLRIYYRINK